MDGWTIPYAFVSTCDNESIEIDCKGLIKDKCPASWTPSEEEAEAKDLLFARNAHNDLYSGCASPCTWFEDSQEDALNDYFCCLGEYG